eukprot:gb/GECG01005003.1/.p1 GENE.gb/GECG01005003.1/~~gb/GECG01005003.1/.p1  ORF type:complete len:303 (+),score=12.45 gb/GECG01005003.1/:1-909(+)
MSDVLQVYLRTWFQHLLQPEELSEDPFTLSQPVSLDSAASYWAKVAQSDPNGDHWVYQLEWPRCGTCCRTDKQLYQLWGEFPNFRGHVRYGERPSRKGLRGFLREPEPVSLDRNSGMTSHAFRYLSNVTSLEIWSSGIDDTTFQHFSRLCALDMALCLQYTITDLAFSHLSELTWLRIQGCSQRTLSDAAFEHLSKLVCLDMSECRQTTITDSAFQHLSSLESLNMSWCDQVTITDSAFEHLSALTVLNMRGCIQSTITDSGFSHLSSLQILNANGCTQRTITRQGLANALPYATCSRKQHA